MRGLSLRPAVTAKLDEPETPLRIGRGARSFLRDLGIGAPSASANQRVLPKRTSRSET